MASQRGIGAFVLALAVWVACFHFVSAQQNGQVVFCGASEDGATEGCGRATPGLLFLAISPFTFWPFVILWIISFVFCIKETDWSDFDCCRGSEARDDNARVPAPRAEPTAQALPLATNPMGAPPTPNNPDDAVAVPIPDSRRGVSGSSAQGSAADSVSYARGGAARRRGRGRGGAANNRNRLPGAGGSAAAGSGGGANSSDDEAEHKDGDEEGSGEEPSSSSPAADSSSAAAASDNASRRDSNTLPPIAGARAASTAAALAARARAAATTSGAFTPAADGQGGMWSNGVWACKTCSLHNKPTAVTCSACSSAKVSSLPAISGPCPPIPE